VLWLALGVVGFVVAVPAWEPAFAVEALDLDVTLVVLAAKDGFCGIQGVGGLGRRQRRIVDDLRRWEVAVGGEEVFRCEIVRILKINCG